MNKDCLKKILRIFYRKKRKGYKTVRYLFGIKISSKLCEDSLVSDIEDMLLTQTNLLTRINNNLSLLNQQRRTVSSSDFPNKMLLFQYDYQELEKAFSVNLGDYVQTIATKNALDKLPYKFEYLYFDRDNLINYQGDKTLAIMQGWFSHSKIFMPDNSKILPVYIGTHICSESYKYFLSFYKSNPHYFENRQIGCRDKHTKDFLCSLGIDAYLSRCVTLTLDKRIPMPTQDKVFIVNVPQKFLKYIPDNIRANAIYINQRGVDSSAKKLFINTRDKYLSKTQSLLERYRNEAKLVITTALHCASPCTAIGIPVVLFNLEKSNERFSALDGIIPYYSSAEIKSGKVNYSPSVPDIEPLKSAMLKNLELSIEQAKGNDVNVDEIYQIRDFISDFSV